MKHVALVLDMSGSMEVVTEPTRKGAIDYIKDIRKEDPDALFTLTIFDTEFETWADSVPLSDVKAQTLLAPYQPRGMTALYDAVGSTIAKMRKKVTKGDGAVLVVMTDGQENSSTEFDRKKLAKEIKKLTADGWTFLYLGANVDAWDEAEKMGVAAGNTVVYASTAVSAGAVMDSAGEATRHSLRHGPSTTTYADAGLKQDYRDEDEDDSA